MTAWIYKLSLPLLKIFLQHRKFVSLHGHVISSIITSKFSTKFYKNNLVLTYVHDVIQSTQNSNLFFKPLPSPLGRQRQH